MFVFRRRAAQSLVTRGSLNKRGPPRVTRHGSPAIRINFVLRYDIRQGMQRQLIRKGRYSHMYSQEIRLAWVPKLKLNPKFLNR